MNMTEEHVRQYQMKEKLHVMEAFTKQHFRIQPLTLWAYDTYQFKDYSLYESSVFSEPDKAAWREAHWPQQCKEAYDIGKALAEWEDVVA